MDAKLKSKTHLLNTFFDLLSRFLRVLLQSWKKCYYDKFLDNKSRKMSKNEEFHADFKFKKCTKQKL
jgi:hypothetical protein